MTLPTKCVKIAISAESLPAVREWARTVNSRPNEVLATLSDEGVVVETVFLDESAGGAYLLYFVKAADLDRANEVAARSTHDIDAYHKRFQRLHWGERRGLEMLIDFDRFGAGAQIADTDA